MDLGLSAEQRLLVESARAFLADACPLHRLRALEADPQGFDPITWKRMGGLGWLGGDRTFLDGVLLLEEMGRVLLPSPFLASAVLSTQLLRALGSETQQRRWLGPMAAGEVIMTPAITEPGWHDEWQEPALAVRRSPSELHLTGIKSFVPFAAQAQLLLVSARVDGSGTSLVAVDRSTAGLQFSRLVTLGGDPSYQVSFADVCVRHDAVVGPPGGAGHALARMLSCATVGALAYAVGAAERVLDMAIEYARTRVQFGRPIGSFQAVAHRCVDMRSDLDALRYLVYQAAWGLDAGRSGDLEVSAAKAYGNGALRRIFMHAHQVHGAIGFSTEHDLHLFTRRAKTTELSWGSTALHLERVAQAMGL